MGMYMFYGPRKKQRLLERVRMMVERCIGGIAPRAGARVPNQCTVDRKNVNNLQSAYPTKTEKFIFVNHLYDCEGDHSHGNAKAIRKFLELVCTDLSARLRVKKDVSADQTHRKIENLRS